MNRKNYGMAKRGPILLADEDPDDQDIIHAALTKMKVRNKLLCFKEGSELIRYLLQTEDKPFMILCNIHISGMDGLAIRRKIEETPELKDKSIPFIFFTSDDRKEIVEKAFEIPVQGYFCKEDTLEKVERLLALLYDYWSRC